MSAISNVKEVGKFRGAVLGSIISIAGYFFTFLGFAMSYGVNHALVVGFDPSAPNPEKEKLKLISFAVGNIFPFIAGFFCGRANRFNDTYSHFILCLATGLYVYYLTDGQVPLMMAVAYVFLAIISVVAGFKLAKINSNVV